MVGSGLFVRCTSAANATCKGYPGYFDCASTLASMSRFSFACVLCIDYFILFLFLVSFFGLIFAFIPFKSRGYEDTPTQVAGFKSDGGTGKRTTYLLYHSSVD